MNTVFIYALNDPTRQHLGKTRYIGKAADPYRRYEEHLKTCREKTHKASWIWSLLRIGQTPILEILDEVPEVEWELWEREWIRLYRALGFRLTNGTDGGEGLKNPSLETRKKMRDSHIGKTLTTGHRKKISDAGLGRVPTAATRIKLSIANRNKHPTLESRERNRIAHAGRRHSPESRIKISAVLRGRPVSIYTREKIRASLLGRKHSPARVANLKAAWVKRKAQSGN